MSYKPQRVFAANVGEPSTSNAGPDAIEADFDKVMKMFDPNATHDDNSPGGITADNLRPELLASFVAIPTGMIMPYCAPVPPEGWLECDGSAVSRTNYAALFALFGTTFGVGDGLTTFNLPDLRGEFVRGWDHGRGADPGRQFGSGQADELKSHNHTLNQWATQLFWSGTNNGSALIDTGLGPKGTVTTNQNVGSETRPRNVALIYCIKY